MRREDFYREARSDVDGPLHGIRVLDVTRVWSGPQATCVLADMGADVIRVELPNGRDGDVPPNIPGTGLSWFRESVNRNKRSVGLDLRESASAFLDLVRDADLVVENYRPGTLSGWGAGYEDCRKVKPDIIFVSITGWGQYGTGIDRPAYDPAVQAASGWMALNGDTRAPTFLADELAGLHAAIGALAALNHRHRTGEGQHVDVAMLDAVLASSCGLLTLAAAGAPPVPMGNETDFVVPSNVYPCQDGSVYLAVALNKHWRALVALLGQPDLARHTTNVDRLAHRGEINTAVASWCAERPVAFVIKAFTEAGLVAERIRPLAEVATDPHVLERDMLQNTRLHNGTVAPLTGPAAKFSRTPTKVRFGASAPGADTESVLTQETRI
ncbi:CaiB/BaiF CoA transferase family protein [Catelliglobosispora koreensis]|uniref:CaiB/BaiF CoA transferase family protein n=1 Tax=Catelliglobosispora koreensis TaxID=129052 RepID=UPI00036580F9|nr:CoA transferase [Catelliglobosispora koreensis]